MSIYPQTLGNKKIPKSNRNRDFKAYKISNTIFLVSFMNQKELYFATFTERSSRITVTRT